MFLLLQHDGHPYASLTRRPPKFTIVEAPTLRECVALFNNVTGWDAASGTPCCGRDFAIYDYAEEPTEFQKAGGLRAQTLPIAEFNPHYIRASEHPPEARVISDEDWGLFCCLVDWIAEKYGFDYDGNQVSAHG